ncbi:transcriptional regulator LysR [Gluconobacter thailandicus F149-1 = NBRC 100600]|uniref:LysR family transcriptional regulator n=2 Tax=Gluconobacter thailandicus TaxID=257438 RepID=A0AAJ0VMC3_GLUTH|nr:LysR family transcriptional regulator [Gluconobacter thailandicus]KXV35260.1 LysR family transcriptional regulator [Gluconobacter thailandicus]KXV54998.1 LysR family transcriptional regulator [Gluconobacter thailandicus]QEH97006.1 LysR family transcriptional regulator [Gluconobacter thailandicus]GAC89464.1 LysR family transcriptional regulator [Gluconobacter thailandicus NBRC 3255]GAD28284.1 LysR family transcriptional regulator [Gluconobacter thailandicus NBRC 3257]
MRLRQIEVFYAIMTTGSLRKAAEVLHVSQPAASKVLRYAEHSLGFALFERKGGRLIPTREAQIMLPHVNAIFGKLSDLRRLTYNLRYARDGHSIRVGCVPSLGLSLIPRVVRSYCASHPDTDVTIDTLHGSEIVSRIFNHDLDLGVVFGNYSREGLTAQHIGDIPLVLIDKERESGPVALTDIDHHRYLGLSEKDPTADLLDIALDEAGVTMTPAIRVRTHFMAAELVRLGVGCAIVDALTVMHHPGLPRPCALSPSLNVTCTVLYRADYALSHISRDILTLMQHELDCDLRQLNEMI